MGHVLGALAFRRKMVPRDDAETRSADQARQARQVAPIASLTARSGGRLWVGVVRDTGLTTFSNNLGLLVAESNVLAGKSGA